MLIMEQNDETLGWRGQKSLAWSAGTPESATMRRFGPDPDKFVRPPYSNVGGFVGRRAVFQGVLDRVREAQRLFQEAQPDVEPKGRPELEYLASRLKVYEYLAETIVELNTAFIECHRAFQFYESDRAGFVKLLDTMKEHVDRAHHASVRTAQEQARFTDHPSELAVLEYVNCGLIKYTQPFHEFIDKLVALHR